MKFPHLKTSARWLSDFAGRRHLRNYSAVIALLLVHMGISAFAPLPVSGTSHSKTTTPPAGNWVLYATVHNVDFFYQITDCSGNKAVLLKLNNRNANKVKVSWKEVFTTQFEKDKDGVSTKQLLLPTGETFESDCSNVRIKELVVLAAQVNPTYAAEIKKFNFKDIIVTNP